MLKENGNRWSIGDSTDLYEIDRWGKNYFSINESGNVVVHPSKSTEHGIDLKTVVDRMEDRGIDLPILLRFSEILQNRLKEIHDAFATAINDYEYQNKYSCIYPIKVNQQRHVVEEVLDYGRPYGFGLEAGSKPELLAVIAMTDDTTPIICNGFKDAEYIEIAMYGQKLGRTIIPVVEKYTELDLILRTAEQIGVRPKIGFRVKLASRGKGRWSASGGYHSKFGLTVTEVLRALDELKSRGMEDCFQLLHYHQGSQVSNIRYVKAALIEAARIYVDLSKRGAGLKYLDVGGGLGVDYDGSQTDFHSSMNYTLEEYARDVVSHVQSICNEAEVPHPHLLSESGRAVVAFHSVLVFGTLGVAEQGLGELKKEIDADTPTPLRDLKEAYASVSPRTVLESFHDAQMALDMALSMFGNGNLTLEERSEAETLYWNLCFKIRGLISELDHVPEEFEGLDRMLCDTYFCNFSLFQSLPDNWAISQLFPIMPIHRLDEEPQRHAVIGDITCDSDGKIDQFIDRRHIKRTLQLHRYDGKPYYMAAFLVGAYQEVLGDLHNLFGDTNAVHVELDDQGEPTFTHIIKGDTVQEVLHYMQYNEEELTRQMQRSVEQSIKKGVIEQREAGAIMKFYESGLRGYTYLE